MRSKGQGATELLVLLAIIALAGLIIYSASQTKLSESSKTLITSQARAAVNDLASAASEVYSEGVGAKRKVYITIPEGANPSRIFINNTMINLGLTIESQTTDINTQTSMRVVQGADFPTTPGSYWVTVTAMQGYVLIGNSNLLVNPTSLSFQMSPATSANGTVTFTNNGNASLNVTLTAQWSYAGVVDLTLNTTNFILAPRAQSALLVTLQTYAETSLTSYSGVIGVTTNSSEAAQISVNVNVIGNQLPTGVSYITIDTFKDSTYSIRTTNFTLPQVVNITGSYWTPNSNITIQIKDSSGNILNSFNCTVTSSGAVNSTNCLFTPSGIAASQYSVVVSGSSANPSFFNITACP
ncbi:hypothetical protein H0N99_01690 [Candidatus Micrarchaeota archaeon]|nr:hypothetical protein [Candidatus Micrarchaeota archaeon]